MKLQGASLVHRNLRTIGGVKVKEGRQRPVYTRGREDTDVCTRVDEELGPGERVIQLQ